MILIFLLGVAAILMITASILPGFRCRVVLQSACRVAVWTYAVWAVLSLLNPSAFIVFILPLLFVVFPDFYMEWLPFLQLPLAMAFLALAVCCALVRLLPVRMRASPLGRILLVLSLNGVLLATLMITATLKAEEQIAAAVKLLHPVCVQQESFAWSVLNMGDRFVTHVIARSADGSNYYWSYSRQHFFKGNPQLDQNFVCDMR